MLLQKALYSSRVIDQKLSFCLTTSEIFTTGEFCWCQCLPFRCHFSCKVCKKSFWPYVSIMVDYFYHFFSTNYHPGLGTYMVWDEKTVIASFRDSNNWVSEMHLSRQQPPFFFDVSRAYYMYDILSLTTMIGA